MPHAVSHQLHVDPATRLIDLRIAGLVSPEDAAWIGEELRAAIRAMGPDVGQHVTLYDASRVQVLPAETIALLRHTFDNPAVRQLWARKVAFVATTALLRRQVLRLREVRPDIGVFDDREAAVAWLLEE